MSDILVGKNLKLFISEKGNSQRIDKTEITLDSLGVIGDKFYGKDSDRSILITSIESYELVKQYNIEMPLGYLGENILTDYNPYTLAVGTQIKVGSAILQISQKCTICDHLSILDKRIPKLLKKDRGIFAKVIQPGKVREEDDFYLSGV